MSVISGRRPGASDLRSEVFVIGGIHEAHEHARHYTYEVLGEIVAHLHPVMAINAVGSRSVYGAPCSTSSGSLATSSQISSCGGEE